MRPPNKFPITPTSRYQNYLPTAFNDSLDMLQKFNKLLEAFNLLVIDFNEWVEYAESFKHLIDSKEDSRNITVNRKLSPTGDFTGTLAGETIVSVKARISNNTDKLNTLVWQFADGYTGQVIDCGFFDSSNVRRNYDGGVF